MATRQEIQIALDLIKAVNVPNDMLLSAGAPIARGDIKVTEGEFGEQAQRDMTVDERKTNILRLSDQVRGYGQKFASFLATTGNRTQAIAGLKTLGMDLPSLEADMDVIQASSDGMAAEAAKSADLPAMAKVAVTIERDTPALPLVRKG